MKICLAVCEYNPLHNGHLSHINYIKSQLGCDYLAVIMSGNFTQRGDVAVNDKYTRAKHAILAGADIVLELPTVFAVAPAEIFASGAIKLANYIPTEKHICFGTECASKASLMATAKAMLREDWQFKQLLKDNLKEGVTHIQAKTKSLEQLNIKDVDIALLKSPNNILGLEYTKAIISSQSTIQIHPITRQGGGYNDSTLYSNLSSATAIRQAITDKKVSKIKGNLPKYVYADLPKQLPTADSLIVYSLINKSNAQLKNILDCTEGLDNRIKAVLKDSLTLQSLMEKLKTKRYTLSRLKRIVLSSMLNIDEKFIRKCLDGSLYLKVLAIKKSSMNILSILQDSPVPVITRKNDFKLLQGVAKACFLKDVEANDIYNIISQNKTNEYQMLIIE